MRLFPGNFGNFHRNDFEVPNCINGTKSINIGAKSTINEAFCSDDEAKSLIDGENDINFGAKSTVDGAKSLNFEAKSTVDGAKSLIDGAFCSIYRVQNRK